MLNLVLYIALFTNTDIQTKSAYVYMMQNDFEKCSWCLNRIHPRQVKGNQTYYYCKAIASHALMNKKEALDAASYLIDDFTDMPIRYKQMAYIIEEDIKTWHQKDLGELSRKMNNVGKRLSLNKGGKETQRLQKELLEDLDRMIKQEEDDKEKQEADAQAKASKGNADKDNPGGSGPLPQDDSKISGESGLGLVNQKKLKETAEVWGKLPEKERAKALLELTRGMPVRYRDAIQTYLINIFNKSETK